MKLILWNDLVVHEDKLLESELVRSLVEGRLAWDVKIPGEEDLETIGSHQLTLPIPTDVSQMDAVLSAQRGESFILHGPPGTGKSQTITNIIADALYHGKRVLFVAAKKAALDVVYKRLKQIGLEPFALELHSNKSKKSDVLQQLAQSLETVKQGQLQNFEEESKRLDAAKRAISHYVRLLHQQQPIGWSLYSSLVALEDYRKEELPKHFLPAGLLERLDAVLWQQWNDWLPQFQSIAQLLVHPSENPLRSLSIDQYTLSLTDEIDQAIEQFLSSLRICQAAQEHLKEALGFPLPVRSRGEIDAFSKFVQAFQRLPNMPTGLVRYLAIEEQRPHFTEWSTIFGGYQTSLACILANYRRSVLEEDLNAVENEWKEAEQSWFWPKWLKKKKIRKRLGVHALQVLEGDRKIMDLFENYRKLQEATRRLQQERFAELKAALGPLDRAEETDLKALAEKAEMVWQAAALLDLWGYQSMANWMQQLSEQRSGSTDELKKKHAASMAAFCSAYDEMVQKEDEFQRVAGYQQEEAMDWPAHMTEQLQLLREHLPHLKNWVSYRQIAAKGSELLLDWLLEAYEGSVVPIEKLDAYLRATTHWSIVRKVVAADEALSLFNVSLFESKIEQYKEIAAQYKALTIQEMRGKLAAQLPNAAVDAMQSSEPGILQRAIRSRGRGMSIRKLFDQIPNLLPRLAPCMLMSPISVAQYFDVNKEHFDLLIFDEASQLPTCEAVSSLARAKQVIIVGDPKQMPPTAFFTTNKQDEENIEIEDLESILDDCLSLSMPSKYLLRHYRSKHESLIAFSNANYYESKLLTFPSADDLLRKVQYHHVPGVYDKGKTRTNRQEADAIVAFVKAHYEDEKKRHLNLGVVTFSQTQQSLVEEKLEQLYSRHPEIEEWATQAEEPVFVKNLENVQGDERDIILFSVGYAPDETGRMSMNFGPLNRNGGWRRLNVAVTRARYEMHVFATLKAEQIDLSRTSAEGVAGLKAFLNFAQNGQLAFQATQDAKTPSKRQLSEHVRQRLEEKGLEVKCNIGTSGFKVDVGVVHPSRPQQFILGILIDGHYYYQAKTSNDRELVMPSVLKGLGWNLHRIWSLDWQENSDQIVEQILKRVEDLKIENEDEATILPPTDPGPAFEQAHFAEVPREEKAVETLQRPYVASKLPRVHSVNAEAIFELRNRSKLQQQLQAVIETEAPVSRSSLYRRVLQAWGISRIGSRLEKLLDEALSGIHVREAVHHQPFYSPFIGSIVPAFYRANDVEKRKVEDIAPEEIVVAMVEAVNNHLSIEEDELVKYLARLFDFARVGRQVDVCLRYAIDLAVKQGAVAREGSRVKMS